MNRRWRTNLECILRLALVLGATLVAGLLLRTISSYIIDTIYRGTGSTIIHSLFYFLGNNALIIIAAACLASSLFFSNWIFAPIYNGVSSIVRQYIDVDGTGGQQLEELPRHMAGLQASLLDVNRKMQLWQYAMRQAEQRKDDLVVYLAHDIRTPLTSVLGYLELLDENPELSIEMRAKYTGIALRKARRMETLVEELFEITRFNIGNMELERRRVAADVLINQLVEELQPELAGRSIDISLSNEGVTGLFVDADKLARALDNILHNAAYYTPRGGSIAVDMRLLDDGRSSIEISNTGVDISQEKLNRFFEKFYRGDEARQSGTGGSGLGLAIAKNIVEAHGGSISATNADMVTTFRIVI